MFYLPNWNVGLSELFKVDFIAAARCAQASEGRSRQSLSAELNHSSTDQSNPSIVINPAGTELFGGYYSRQDDPNNNALIKAYGAKTILANGFATATFDVFPISDAAFPPLFPGTTMSTPPRDTWKYDHVWAQVGVCLDENAMVAQCPAPPDCGHPTGSTYQHFMADDYTWVSADSSFFYFAWCDRSEIFGSGQQTRPDPNIRLGKIKQ